MSHFFECDKGVASAGQKRPNAESRTNLVVVLLANPLLERCSGTAWG